VQVSQLACEYPGVHPHLHGKQSKYAYLATMDTQDSCGKINVSGAGVLSAAHVAHAYNLQLDKITAALPLSDS